MCKSPEVTWWKIVTQDSERACFSASENSIFKNISARVWVLKIALKMVHEKISEEVGLLSHDLQLVTELEFFDVVANLTYHIRLPQDILH